VGVCGCRCVCGGGEREREREKGEGKGKEGGTLDSDTITTIPRRWERVNEMETIHAAKR
jgi:hypothetical protein